MSESRTTPVSDVMLARFIAGDLPRELQVRIERAIIETPGLAERLEKMKSERAAFLAKYPAEALAHNVVTRITVEKRPRPFWQSLWLLPPVGVAAALLIGVFAQRAVAPGKLGAPAVQTDANYELQKPAPAVTAAPAGEPAPETPVAATTPLSRIAHSVETGKDQPVEAKKLARRDSERTFAQPPPIGVTDGLRDLDTSRAAKNKGDAFADKAKKQDAGAERQKTAADPLLAEDERNVQAFAQSPSADRSNSPATVAPSPPADAKAPSPPPPPKVAVPESASRKEAKSESGPGASGAAAMAQAAPAKPSASASADEAPAASNDDDAIGRVAAHGEKSGVGAASTGGGGAGLRGVASEENAVRALNITLTRQQGDSTVPVAGAGVIPGGSVVTVRVSGAYSGVVTVVGVRHDGVPVKYGEATLQGGSVSFGVRLRPTSARVLEALFVVVSNTPITVDKGHVSPAKDASQLPMRLSVDGVQRRHVITVSAAATGQ